ncbi:MAG: AraC family transcriptional regulator [Kordia sp.]|nr:MAG: AraC family transcriptional regulator [Kordia sp.]
MNFLPILNIKQFEFNVNEGDFYANDFSSHLEKYHATITKPHKHDFYLIVLFTEGAGVHEVDFDSYPIKRGALFLMNPGQTHHWEFTEAAKGFIFFHSKEFYNLSFPNKNIDDYPFFYTSHNLPFLMLKVKELAIFIGFFKSIFEEFTLNKFMWHQKLALIVDLLYIETTRLYIKNEQNDIHKIEKEVTWFRKLEQLIDQNFLTMKKASNYANELNVSTKHLNKIVVNTIGKTTTDLIHQRILLEAKRMLTHGELTVQEIAFELGYDDTSYFSRLFKNKCGVSPSVFSNKYINK